MPVGRVEWRHRFRIDLPQIQAAMVQCLDINCAWRKSVRQPTLGATGEMEQPHEEVAKLVATDRF
jgi:hypothetical protein